MNTNTFDWEAAWRKTLAGMPAKIWCTDLDDTVWGDVLVHLNEAFGPIDTSTGLKQWRKYDHAYKVAGTMTNGQHLVAEYRDLLAVKTLPELVAWAKSNIPLIPGAPEFVSMLGSCGVGIVAISNGARQIAEPKLAHHGLPIPLMSNWFEGDELKFVHDEHVGIDKGLLVEKAIEWGYEVVGFSGDAKGDIKGAEATARHGGLVIAQGNHGLAQWCASHLQPEQWQLYTDFRSVMASRELQSRIGGN